MRNRKQMVSAITGLALAIAAMTVWAGERPELKHPEAVRPKPAVLGVAGTGQSPKQALNAYAKLPVTFVENRGQTDKRVRYYAQGPQHAFYLTPDEVVLSFVKGAVADETPGRQRASYGTRLAPLAARTSDVLTAVHAVAAKEPITRGVALHLRFLGSNPRVEVTGEERAPGQMNYLQGNDSTRWHTQLSHYTQVVYHSLWPGVDMRVYEQASALKYEFHVRPGARLSDIQLAYTGMDSLTLDSTGGLRLKTALGVLHDAPPVSYQDIGGKRVSVESHYLLHEKRYGFAVGAGYKPDQELIIDPGLDYSTFLGGASHESGAGIAVDSAGNAYIVGVTQSPDFPTTVGAFARNGAVSNFSDVFVTKLNPTGTALVYSTFIGGSDLDFGRAIAIDAAGNAYITGLTKSSNFPTTKNAFDRTFNFPNTPRGGIDNTDAFVAKLNPTGTALVYSTFLGGATDIDNGNSIAIDAAGDAYVTGQTNSSDFPVTRGAFRTVPSGGGDAFVTKLNPTGSALVYSTYLGGSQADFGVRIAVDASNSAYVLGETRSPDFPTTPGAFNTSLNGGFDLFVLKFNAAGSNLVYSTYLGGADMESAGGLAIDSVGNAYVTGSTVSLNFPGTPGAFKPVSDGKDGFVTKFNPTGSALVYSTLLGSASISAIALDAFGNAYLTGGTSSPDFPTTPGAVSPVFNGGSGDAIVAELSADGAALLYATYLGGTNSEFGSDIARGASGSLYITGQTLSADFPTTPGAFDRVWKGDLQIFWADAFVTRLTPSSVPAPPILASVTTSPGGIIGGNYTIGTVALSSGAPAGGALVALSSSNGAVVGVPASVQIPAGTTSVTFAVNTDVVATSTFVTITATYSGLTRTAMLTLTPPPSLQSVTLIPSSVVGGNGSQGTVTLTFPAPAGGAAISLVSSNTTVATVPPSVTVIAGATSATFPVSTSPVTTPTSATIIGVFGGASSSAVLTVTPPIILSSFTVSPASVTGGTTSVGTVTLTSTAPTGGFAVTLTSSNSTIAIGPASGSVTVAQGATSASFAIGTNSVPSPTPVTFTASTGGVTRMATLMVTPPQTATLTVTATGRNGEQITSSPAGINAPVGSSLSASFPIGTVITLTVSNGRSAIWSGAASSGGSKTKTLTFTLNGNATITANVQ